LDDWGSPVAEISSDMTHTAAPVKVLLGNRRAQAVLVWLTDLGDAPGSSYRFELREATLHT
ncbi:MAG TPA: hypothetical protein VGH94_15425, partial [Acidimicrobiales bacterium]